jgi:threonine dehydrogenase-like Zn-dependent dehydrogenase
MSFGMNPSQRGGRFILDQHQANSLIRIVSSVAYPVLEAQGMGARVILVDPLPLRRAAAEKIGVDGTVDPSAGDAVAKVLELTGGKGADLVIEASGHDASLAAVLDYVRTGGRVTFVGISIGRKIPVELGKIQGKSLTIKGTIGSPGVWPAAMRFLARIKLDLSPIQTHFFDLTQGIEAFEFGKNPKECIKVTLTNEA